MRGSSVEGGALSRSPSVSLSHLLERFPSTGPMVAAACIGLLTGAGAVGFAALIDATEWLFFDRLLDDWLGPAPSWLLVLAPTLGGLLVGPLVVRFAPEARGAGVSQVLLAVETQGGRIRPRVALTKTVASALTIGSGGSAGKVGPIVQIGAAVGSNVARLLRSSEDMTKLLLAAGSAGGIAATFHAPIAGVFFALEVILRRFNSRYFSVVVISSVAATTTAVMIQGDAVGLPVPGFRLESALEIPLYVLLGVLAGVAGAVFTRLLHGAEDRFSALTIPPRMLMPAIGGFLVGCIALLHDGVLGASLSQLDEVLTGEPAVTGLILFLALKMVATSITVGSGGSGGVFQPSLVIGGALGGVFGAVVHGLLPASTAPPGAWATVGMAALFASTARAPITAVLIIFELTRDYAIILPLMTASVTATVVSQQLLQHSIFTLRLARRGVVIEEEAPPENVMQSLRVADAMAPVMQSVSPRTPLPDIARLFAQDHDAVALVLNDGGEVVGVVTHTDVTEALSDDGEAQVAMDVASTEVTVIHPDQSLHDAVATFAGRPFHALPVTFRERPRVPCGILRRSDITNAYATAMERRDASTLRRRLDQVTGDDVRYLELRVDSSSALNGHRLADVPLPDDAVIATVRRTGHTLIPRGQTRLRAGDRVMVIARADAVEVVEAIFSGTGDATHPTPVPGEASR